MKRTNHAATLAVGLSLAALSGHTATLYVWPDSPNPTAPYTNWDAAAHTIQEAVDVAESGSTVLVTNGIYASGARAISPDQLQNRVAVYKPLLLQSVTGPGNTIIQGYRLPDTTNGDGAIRCVYLGEGAVLSGFTVNNGATRDLSAPFREQCGGGIWCETFGATATNCIVTGNAACYEGGGASAGVLTHCTLIGNTSHTGGAASGTRLEDCTLVGNSALEGGGTYGATVVRCTLVSNRAVNAGGASEGTVEDSLLSENVALERGGGAAWSDMVNCRLVSNQADQGGGAFGCGLNNCILSVNSASSEGGGTHESGLNNCSLAGNSAAGSGGGAYNGVLNNCALYSNTASNGANYAASEWSTVRLNFCCTTPLPTNGIGNISSDPGFVDLAGGDFHLRPNSPCINSGNNTYSSTPTDLDGNPRIAGGTVDIGAYEFPSPASIISYAWLQQYDLPTDGSADGADPDGDHMTNWQEWIADTDPTSAASCFYLTNISTRPVASVAFQSSGARLYTLLSSTNLASTTGAAIWHTVNGQVDIPGTGDPLTLIDTNTSVRAFYRVSVRR